MAYPTLVERALKLIESEGPIGEADLVRALFGNAVGPWPTLVQRVLGDDPRLVRLPDCRYALAERELPHAGLVVLATGPKPWKDPIVAIGAARWQGDRLETDEWFVQPNEPCRIPKYLTKYGVTYAALEEGMPLERAVEHLLDFVGEAPLAGLDVAVGVARLQFALRALGRPTLANQLRELAVAQDERPDLVRLAKEAGLPAPDRLRPSSLAALAARLAGAGRSTHQAREERGAYSASTALDSTSWRHLLDARLLEQIPDSPGVYLFRDAAGRLLYVGKATSLRSRLGSYLTGNFPLVRQMPGLVEATARLDHDPLPCELAARLREAELIAAEQPPYNVQRQVEPRFVKARLVLTGEIEADGRRVPRLNLDEAENGLLTTARAASEALAEAKQRWWPPRPKAGERPTVEQVTASFRTLSAQFETTIGKAPLTDALRAEDLANGLLVGAPERTMRRTADPEPADDDGWTRERVDEEWRRARPVPEPREPRWAALLVDAGGLRACAALDHEPTCDNVERVLAEAEVRPAVEAGLAALSVLVAALRRGEPGVVAWPRR